MQNLEEQKLSQEEQLPQKKPLRIILNFMWSESSIYRPGVFSEELQANKKKYEERGEEVVILDIGPEHFAGEGIVDFGKGDFISRDEEKFQIARELYANAPPGVRIDIDAHGTGGDGSIAQDGVLFASSFSAEQVGQVIKALSAGVKPENNPESLNLGMVLVKSCGSAAGGESSFAHQLHHALHKDPAYPYLIRGAKGNIAGEYHLTPRHTLVSNALKAYGITLPLFALLTVIGVLSWSVLIPMVLVFLIAKTVLSRYTHAQTLKTDSNKENQLVLSRGQDGTLKVEEATSFQKPSKWLDTSPQQVIGAVEGLENLIEQAPLTKEEQVELKGLLTLLLPKAPPEVQQKLDDQQFGRLRDLLCQWRSPGITIEIAKFMRVLHKSDALTEKQQIKLHTTFVRPQSTEQTNPLEGTSSVPLPGKGYADMPGVLAPQEAVGRLKNLLENSSWKPKDQIEELLEKLLPNQPKLSDGDFKELIKCLNDVQEWAKKEDPSLVELMQPLLKSLHNSPALTKSQTQQLREFADPSGFSRPKAALTPGVVYGYGANPLFYGGNDAPSVETKPSEPSAPPAGAQMSWVSDAALSKVGPEVSTVGSLTP